MPVIELKLNNFEQWKKEADQFVATGTFEGFKTASLAIRATFRKFERKLFATEGSSGKHGKWPELSEKYKKWKDKNFPGKNIMVLHERLINSLTNQAAESIYFTSKQGNKFRLVIGTDVRSKEGFDYPKHHQEKAKKVRRSIDPTDSQMDTWALLIEKGVYEQARKYGTLFDVARESMKARMDKREI